MRNHQRTDGGILDEEAEEGITKLIFAEYRTDNHATAQDEPKHNAATWIPSTEDGQVPVAGASMTAENEGELEYGSILPNGEDWRLRKFDGGMGETEYRIFRNGNFFAQCANRKDADAVMEAMIHPYNPQAEHNAAFDEGFEIGKAQCETHHEEIKYTEREKVLDELDEIAKKGMKGKEDSLGEKYCKEHPKQVSSCWHGLHRLIQKLRQGKDGE